MENATAVPLAEQQCHFHVEATIGNRSTAAFDRAMDSVFDGVRVEVKFFGSGLEA